MSWTNMSSGSSSGNLQSNSCAISLDVKQSSISVLKFLFTPSISLHISCCYLPAAASCSVPSLPPTDEHVPCTLYSLCCPTEPYRGARATRQVAGKAGRTEQQWRLREPTRPWIDAGVQAFSLLCAEQSEILSQHSDNSRMPYMSSVIVAWEKEKSRIQAWKIIPNCMEMNSFSNSAIFAAVFYSPFYVEQTTMHWQKLYFIVHYISGITGKYCTRLSTFHSFHE